MRPEMDEFDVGMEQRLRNVVVDRQSRAPGRLIDFVCTVPASRRRAGRVELALERPRVRRSLFALGAAAAVVVAVASSAVLVSYRYGTASGSPTPAGIVSDGWAWQATDGTLFLAASKVPNGFVAECGGRSSQSFVDETLCSSKDGLHWSYPPDPAIVSVAGTEPFLPQQIFVRKGIYLATSARASGEHSGPGRTLWRSTDGVHWAQVDTSASPGPMSEVNVMSIAPDGFMADVMMGSGTETGMFLSPDGIAWSKASDLPFDTGGAGSGYYIGPTMTAGLYAAGVGADGTTGPTWRTTNGRDWQVVNMPTGYSQLNSVVTLPDGSLRGVASTFDNSAPNVIVDSADGLTWRIDSTGPTGSVDMFVVVGDRMVAYVSTSNTGPHQILQSDDWGKTWRPLLDLSGQPVVGSVATVGGRLEIQDTDLATHWLLTPVQENPPASPIESAMAPVSASPSEPKTPAVTAAPSPTISVNRTPLPASLTGEWTWRQTDGTHFAGAFAVPGGFIATCGHIAGNELADASLCSSRDGLNWKVPADPGLIQVQGEVPFWPISVTERNGVYLSHALSRPLPTVVEPTGSLWRSTDGRHWSQVDSPALAGQSLVGSGLLADRFAAIVKSADGTAAAVWLSTDGSTWSKASDLPTVPTRSGFYSQGLYVEGNEATRSQVGTWLTTDGKQWTPVTLPAGATNILSSIRMPDGGFVGLGVDFVSGGNGTLMHSSDGLVWEADHTTPAGNLFSLSQVGDRLVVTISQPNNDGPYSVWQSSDRGQTWQPLPGPDGYQLTTMTGQLGDNLSSVTGSDAVVVAVGTLNSR